MRCLFRKAAAPAALASLLALSGCSGGAAAGSSGDTGPRAGSLLPDTVGSPTLGILNGEEITLANLADQDRSRLAQLRNDYHTQAHGLLEEAAVQAARETLLLAAAEEQGLTLNQYYIEEIGLPEVTDAEVEMVYEQNRQQLGGRTFEEVEQNLRRQIGNQKFSRKIELAGDRMLAEADWDLTVPAYRLPIETDGHATLGPADAPVEVVVFSCFECPHCRRFNTALDELRTDEELADRIRIVFRHFPLRSMHPRAQKAHEAAVCAEAQGKFWEYHDALWADTDLSVDTLGQHARLLGLDADEFARCLNSGESHDRVQADLDAALDIGQTGTPAVFLNGRKIGGAVPIGQLRRQVERELGESN